MGSIALLFDPLDPAGLGALLDLQESMVRMTLCSLHSMVIVPDTGDGPVRLIHPSSHDFLIDKNRCDDASFAVNSPLQHTLLAERCLRALSTLTPDMCRIGDASLYNQEVAGLQTRIASLIPAHDRRSDSEYIRTIMCQYSKYSLFLHSVIVTFFSVRNACTNESRGSFRLILLLTLCDRQ